MSKILVVEDSKYISVMIEMCLNKHGFEIVTRYDGLAAMDQVYTELPDLILLDVLIPKMDGYLVVQALKQGEDTRHIPIVIMSAKAQEDDINKALQLGAEDYIVKPFTSKMLLEKINKYIN